MPSGVRSAVEEQLKCLSTLPPGETVKIKQYKDVEPLIKKRIVSPVGKRIFCTDRAGKAILVQYSASRESEEK